MVSGSIVSEWYRWRYGRGEPLEDASAVVGDLGGLAVQEPGPEVNGAADDAERLVA